MCKNDKESINESVERVSRYEPMLRELLGAISAPGLPEPGVEALQPLAEALSGYYESEAWKRDFAADEAGLFPAELQRGVLSEDGIYNALEAYRERLAEMKAAGPGSTPEKGETSMDIWDKLYEKARQQYHPEEVSPFVTVHHVVCALEAENGDIYTGFCIESCSGVMNLCAERVAALNMYLSSGQTRIRRMIAFRDRPPFGGGSGMPCGACREFLYQLDERNENMEILSDFEKRETVTLKDLMPGWWGKQRYAEARGE